MITEWPKMDEISEDYIIQIVAKYFRNLDGTELDQEDKQQIRKLYKESPSMLQTICFAFFTEGYESF